MSSSDCFEFLSFPLASQSSVTPTLVKGSTSIAELRKSIRSLLEQVVANLVREFRSAINWSMKLYEVYNILYLTLQFEALDSNQQGDR